MGVWIEETWTFTWGIEEKGAREAGREWFRDSEGVGLRENNPLRIIHLSLPASRTPFSGQVVKKSTGTWLHKEVEEHKWTSVGELRTLEKTIVF